MARLARVANVANRVATLFNNSSVDTTSYMLVADVADVAGIKVEKHVFALG